jgi:hypothetical protein
MMRALSSHGTSSRPGREGADVHDDFVGLVALAGNLDLAGPDEARVAAHELEVRRRLLQVLAHPVAPLPHDAVLAVDHRGQVHLDGSRLHAEAGRGAGHVRRLGAGHHRLGRSAAVVHAGAAQGLALGDHDPAARRGQTRRQRHAGLAGPDHDDFHEASLHPPG